METVREFLFENCFVPNSSTLYEESSWISWHLPSSFGHLKSIVIKVNLYKYNFQNDIVEF